MMQTTKLTIGDITFEHTHFVDHAGEVCWPSTSINWVNKSTDHYSSDSDESEELDKEKAEAIIKFLQQHFNI
jgi:hypothetical protein